MFDDYRLAQGPAKPATPEDITKDEQGITNPNLHRRIDNGDVVSNDYILLTPDNYELATPDDFSLVAPVAEYVENDTQYSVLVQAVNSYRSTSYKTHDEDSTTSEVP